VVEAFSRCQILMSKKMTRTIELMPTFYAVKNLKDFVVVGGRRSCCYNT